MKRHLQEKGKRPAVPEERATLPILMWEKGFEKEEIDGSSHPASGPDRGLQERHPRARRPPKAPLSPCCGIRTHPRDPV
jgi:hypothetical protein